MTQRRALRAALLGGTVGAITILAAGRGLVTWLIRVDKAPASGARCLRFADTAYAHAIAAATPRLIAAMREKRIPGMTVAVAVDERVIWSEGFGFADIASKSPACPETRFRIGSVSKPITAAAMARLYEAGKLELDAPIQRYAVAFPDKGYPITARQLAGHRAGIRHYRDDTEAFNTRHFANVNESLELFRDDSLLFTPGDGHHYSSYGYVLLSAVLEGASGLSFDRVLEQYVLRPLDLTRTGLDVADSMTGRPPNVTRFYDHVTPYVLDGQVRPSPFVDMSSKWAGGGMLSTSEDLVRFGSALLPDAPQRFLRPQTREMLFTPTTRLMPPIFGYAMGWMTARDADLRRVYMHFGAGSGATAWIGVFPDDRMAIAVLANLGHAGLPYASSIGLATHFASPPTAPAVTVAIVAFVGFALATAAMRLLIGLVTSRQTRRS